MPGYGGLRSGLVKLLARCWGGMRGARLLRLCFPQVVIAEVALEALELGIVVVGCGVTVRATGLWQVISADIPVCRKTDQSAQRAREQPSGCLLLCQQRVHTRVSKIAVQMQLDLGKVVQVCHRTNRKPPRVTGGQSQWAVSGSQDNCLHQTDAGKGQGDRLGPTTGKQEEGRACVSPCAPSQPYFE